MKSYKVFLASSVELTQERIEIAQMIYKLNNKWKKEEKGIYIELVAWEDLLDAFQEGAERTQDYINREMLNCDIVITLFSRKLRPFLEEEFKLAYENFRKGNKPEFMFVYFKSGSVSIEDIDVEILKIGKLKKEIQDYKDVYGTFNSVEDLILKLQQRLESAIFHEHKTPVLNLPIRLKRLKLHNIKCFKDVELSFLEKEKSRTWTLLVGDNGVGKTTILQSIALCSLGPELAQGISGPQNMLRIGEDEGYIEAEFDAPLNDDASASSPAPIGIRLIIKKGSRTFEIDKGGAPANIENAAKFIDKRRRTDFEGWFVAGYGPVRNLLFTDEPFKISQQDTVIDRIESLFNPTKLLVDPLSLYRFLSGDSSPFNAMGAPNELNRETTRYIQELLVKLLPRISFNGSVAQGTMETSFGRVPITELSEGYKSMLSWLAHLMIHLLRAVHWEGNINDIKGIVLIDELDLHLHPGWQQKVIPLLQDCFPNLQFIGCTHSPMTAGGAGDGDIILLEQYEGEVIVNQDLPSIKGWRADQILTGPLFGLESTRDLSTKHKMDEYSRLLGLPKLSREEKKRLHELESIMEEAIPSSGETQVERDAFRLIEDTMDAYLNSQAPDKKKQILGEIKRQLHF